mgnify:CR=1 FL=1
MQVLKRDSLKLGGFAGLTEHRMVTDSRAFGGRKAPGTWEGIGNFIYLADARFQPFGETGMHGHREIDVISVVLEGRIEHGGSMGQGQYLHAGDVQVQRAGDIGFSHNEVNPDSSENRMLQLWVLPEKPNQPEDYEVITPKAGVVTPIYGGANSALPTETTIVVHRPQAGEKVQIDKDSLLYICDGLVTDGESGFVDGDLIRTDQLTLTAKEPSFVIVVSA